MAILYTLAAKNNLTYTIAPHPYCAISLLAGLMLASWNCLVPRYNAHACPIYSNLVQRGLLLHHVWRQNDVRFLSHHRFINLWSHAGKKKLWYVLRNYRRRRAGGSGPLRSAWQRKSSKYSNNAATRYSALATTDRPWYRPQARSPALRCGYKIMVQSSFIL